MRVRRRGLRLARGLGRLVNQLWLQDRVAVGEIEIMKVKGEVNLADALTKHVEADKLGKHNQWVGLEIRGGRHEIMPEVNQEEWEEDMQDESEDE